MQTKIKIIWILFYCFALLVLIITGSVKSVYFGNYWKACLDIIKNQKYTEDKDWKLQYKHAKNKDKV